MKNALARTLILIATLPSLQVMAAAEPKTILIAAMEAERANRPGDAIRSLESLVAGNTLRGADIATAWDILGLSYVDEGRFAEAHRAFERAISAFKALPDVAVRAGDLGDLLSNLADVYTLTNQFDEASHLRLKALQLYQQAGNFAAAVRGYANLAGIELSKKHFRQARKYVAAGYAALPGARNLDSDDLAAFYLIRGWELETEKNYRDELASYVTALKLWQGKHGEAYGMSGWAHMLAGKAYAELDDISSAEKEMQVGLPIVKGAFGEHSLQYLTAQIAYSNIIDRKGDRAVAQSLRSTAQRQISTIFSNQCATCLVSVNALH